MLCIRPRNAEPWPPVGDSSRLHGKTRWQVNQTGGEKRDLMAAGCAFGRTFVRLIDINTRALEQNIYSINVAFRSRIVQRLARCETGSHCHDKHPQRARPTALHDV